jgi:hypothetical protein
LSAELVELVEPFSFLTCDQIAIMDLQVSGREPNIRELARSKSRIALFWRRACRARINMKFGVTFVRVGSKKALKSG